jgi:hypothetical protein
MVNRVLLAGAFLGLSGLIEAAPAEANGWEARHPVPSRCLVATSCKLARRASSLGATSVHPCREHHDGTCAPTSWP